ncbi:MAG: hypothetical protein VB055_06965 [Oscillospiraceae bacterium]|nr:hypothetical protein [Oscillospiraceae bacterium]
MEDVSQNSNYRSAWRPLSRENDLSTVSTSPGVETLKKSNESDSTPAARSDTSGQKEILDQLAETRSDIAALNQMLSEQSEKLDRLLGLLEEIGAGGKKKSFGLSWK